MRKMHTKVVYATGEFNPQTKKVVLDRNMLVGHTYIIVMRADSIGTNSTNVIHFDSEALKAGDIAFSYISHGYNTGYVEGFMWYTAACDISGKYIIDFAISGNDQELLTEALEGATFKVYEVI